MSPSRDGPSPPIRAATHEEAVMVVGAGRMVDGKYVPADAVHCDWHNWHAGPFFGDDSYDRATAAMAVHLTDPTYVAGG